MLPFYKAYCLNVACHIISTLGLLKCGDISEVCIKCSINNQFVCKRAQ